MSRNSQHPLLTSVCLCLYLCPPSGPVDGLSCSKCQLPSGLHSIPLLFACIAPKILCCLRLFLKSSVLPFLLHYSHVTLRLAPSPRPFPLDPVLRCCIQGSASHPVLLDLCAAFALVHPSFFPETPSSLASRTPPLSDSASTFLAALSQVPELRSQASCPLYLLPRDVIQCCGFNTLHLLVTPNVFLQLDLSPDLSVYLPSPFFHLYF